MSKIILCVVFSMVFSLAAFSKAMSRSSFGGSSESSSMGKQNMMMDVTANYVRDVSPNGDTDTAGRFSIGGMFNEYLGLDGVGIYELRSQNFLVGSELRVMPMDWFYLKGGIGAYSHKRTRELKFAPLAGGGILARVTHEVYVVTETNYFQISDKENIGFGIGLGFYF